MELVGIWRVSVGSRVLFGNNFEQLSFLLGPEQAAVDAAADRIEQCEPVVQRRVLDGLPAVETFLPPVKAPLLADVLGAQYVGKIGGRTTYLSTTDKELTDAIWPQENMGFSVPMVQAQAAAAAEVLATATLPFVDPDEGDAINTRFAQIWSNPPAPQPGQDPGIVIHSFGKGKAVWVAAPLELRADAVNARVFNILLRRALRPPYKFEADADPAVEVTLFHQEDRSRLLVGMLNLQAQVPTLPVAATLRIQVPVGHSARKVSLLPEEKEIPFTRAGSYISFQVPSFNLVSMVLVDYA